MSSLHDFRIGNNTWGHAIHGNTLGQIKPTSIIQRLSDWKKKAVRLSVMVHCSRYPKIGDMIAWSKPNGHEVIAPIIGVYPCRDPDDMYTIVVYVTPDCRRQV